MRNFIINKKLKTLAGRHYNRQRHFQPFDVIRTVLVLFETSEQVDVPYVTERLRSFGKQVFTCGYTLKDDKQDYSRYFNCLLNAKTDTNWLKQPSKAFMEKINVRSFDAVLDLTLRENKTMQFLLLSTESPLKVGLKKNDLPLYDFSITFNPDEEEPDNLLTIKYLTDQILHYLQTIHFVQE